METFDRFRVLVDKVDDLYHNLNYALAEIYIDLENSNRLDEVGEFEIRKLNEGGFFLDEMWENLKGGWDDDLLDEVRENRKEVA